MTQGGWKESTILNMKSKKIATFLCVKQAKQ